MTDIERFLTIYGHGDNLLNNKWLYRPIYPLTRPISPGRYVDRHSDDMLVDIGRLSTDMHVGRYSFAKPSTLGRHSADTLPTLGRLSALFFLYSICSRLRCPLHLVPALSVGFVLSVNFLKVVRFSFPRSSSRDSPLALAIHRSLSRFTARSRDSPLALAIHRSLSRFTARSRASRSLSRFALCELDL